MSTTEDLADLLERATALEEKAAELKAGTAVVDPPTPTLEELQAKIAELEDTVFALQNSTPAAAEEEPGGDEAAEPGGDEPDADDTGAAAPGVEVEESGLDPDAIAAGDVAPVEDVDLVTPTAEEKALGWEPCPVCGSTNVDAYADGTARCEDCGAQLTRKEGKDFIDEDEGYEVKEPELGPEAKALLELVGAADEEPAAETKAEDAEEPVETKDGLEGGTDTISEVELLMERRARLGA